MCQQNSVSRHTRIFLRKDSKSTEKEGRVKTLHLRNASFLCALVTFRVCLLVLVLSNAAFFLYTLKRESKVLHERVDEALKDFDFSGRLPLLGRNAKRFIPSTINELSNFVHDCSQDGTRVRVVGGSNSYSPIIQSSDEGALVSLFKLDRLVSVDLDAKQVTVEAGIRERDLHSIVSDYGWSLPQVTRKFNVLAGGLNSGHHSSGYDVPEVASAIVVGMKLINGIGDIVTAKPGDDLFYAALVGLGRVGIVVEYTLQCTDKFYLKAVGLQAKTTDMLETMVETAPQKKFWRLIFFPYTGVGYDLSMTSDFEEGEFVFEERQNNWKGKFDLFYDYTSHWLSFHGYLTRMIRNLVKPLNKLQVALIGTKVVMTGRRSDWMLAAGTGISEPPHDSYEMAFPLNKCEDAVKMIMSGLEEKTIPYPWSEVRVSGPSQAWLSPAYGKHVCWFELPTYHQSEETHHFILSLMQNAAVRYEGRPHWGKLNVYASSAPFLASQYPKFAAFARMVKKMDPKGTFSTPWFDRIFEYGASLQCETERPCEGEHNKGEPTAITPLMDEIFSPFHHSALLIFSRLDLFQYIQLQRHVTVTNLAEHTNWSERATSAMLVSLVSSGILKVSRHINKQRDSNKITEIDFFSLSSIGERFLITTNPGHINKFLELFWETSPKLLLEKAASDKKENYMLQTGGGAPSASFIEAMEGQTSFAAETLTPLIDFKSVNHLVDIGGGSGTFAIEACRNHHNMVCSVYELPGVCPLTQQYVQGANMTERVNVVHGNMFEDDSFPPGDCYSFGNVLHDWPDNVNLGLLEKAFRSLPVNGMLVVLEMLIAEDLSVTTRSAAGLNLVMVTNEQGRQYKASELTKMMNEVGFVDVQVISSPLTPYSLVAGKKDADKNVEQ